MDDFGLLGRIQDLEEQVRQLSSYIQNIQVVPPLHSDLSGPAGLVIALDERAAPTLSSFSGAYVGKTYDTTIIQSTGRIPVPWDFSHWDTDNYFQISVDDTKLFIPSDGYYLFGGVVSYLASIVSAGPFMQASTIVYSNKSGVFQASGAQAFQRVIEEELYEFQQEVSAVDKFSAGDWIQMTSLLGPAGMDGTTTYFAKGNSPTVFWIAKLGS
jgi:hypothetical protein